MEFQAVSSSSMQAIGYDAADEVLGIVFDSGTYLYKGVPAQVHEDFLAANSLGRYFQANIKHVYPVSKLEEDEA